MSKKGSLRDWKEIIGKDFPKEKSPEPDMIGVRKVRKAEDHEAWRKKVLESDLP